MNRRSYDSDQISSRTSTSNALHEVGEEDTTDNFIRNIELSARKILRKNNRQKKSIICPAASPNLAETQNEYKSGIEKKQLVRAKTIFNSKRRPYSDIASIAVPAIRLPESFQCDVPRNDGKTVSSYLENRPCHISESLSKSNSKSALSPLNTSIFDARKSLSSNTIQNGLIPPTPRSQASPYSEREVLLESKRLSQPIKREIRRTTLKDSSLTDISKRSPILNCSHNRVGKSVGSKDGAKAKMTAEELWLKYRCEQCTRINSLDERKSARASTFGGTQSAVLFQHPIYSLINDHISSARARIKLWTQERLESSAHEYCISNMIHLKESEKGSAKEKEPLKYNGVGMVLKGNNQTQATALHMAARPFVTDAEGAREKESKSGERNRKHIKLTDECWPLAILEDVLIEDEKSSSKERKISIYRKKERDIQENKPFTASWIIQIYSPSHQLKMTTTLLDKEIDALISGIQPKVAVTGGKKILVHRQGCRKVANDICWNGECSVWIKSEGYNISATICMDFSKDDQDGITAFEDTSSVQLQVSVYEIIARLRKFYVCKALDIEFWSSRTNGTLIWSPLIENIDINFILSDENHEKILWKWSPSMKHLYEKGSNILSNISNVDWEQPSSPSSNEYVNAVKAAYRIIFAILEGRGTGTNSLLSYLFDRRSQNEIENIVQGKEGLPPLSLRLLGTLALSKHISPGACIMEKRRSVEFSNAVESSSILDGQQIAASFTKGITRESCPFIIVTSSMAIDTPIMAPPYNDWDPAQSVPTPVEDEIFDAVIPTDMAPFYAIMKENLKSDMNNRKPPTILTLESSAVKQDWACLSIKSSNSMGHRRDMDTFTKHGFRVKCFAHDTHFLDKTIPSRVYGITERGATPNQTAVNSRSVWHSDDFSTESLSRRRQGDDFHYILQNEFTNKNGGTQNKPKIVVIYMRAHKVKCVKEIRMDAYHESLNKKKGLEQEQRKREALALKIEAANRILQRKIAFRDAITDHVLFQPTNSNLSHKMIPSNGLSDETGEYLFEGNNTLLAIDDLSFNKNMMQSSSKQGQTTSEENDNLNSSKIMSVEQEKSGTTSISCNPSKNIEISLSKLCDPPIASVEIVESLRGYGWRKLPRAAIGADFFKLNKHKIQSCVKEAIFNKCNTIRLVGKVEPSHVIDYKVKDTLFCTNMKSHLISDITADRENMARDKDDEKRSHDLIISLDKQKALEHILQIQNPLKKMDQTLNEQVIDKMNNVSNLDVLYEDSAECEIQMFLAVRNENYESLQIILDEMGMDIESKDSNGNTLLIVACQQGSKKMAKFLLRRGAYIKAQNHSGNTALHYLHHYGHHDLARYLIRKGADDSYLNVEGLTCYEGINKNSLENF